MDGQDISPQVFKALCETVDALSTTVQEQARTIAHLEAEGRKKFGTLSKLEVMLVEIEARVESMENVMRDSGLHGTAPAANSNQFTSTAASDSADPDSTEADMALPPGWSTAVSRSTGDTYYTNEFTGESTYDLASLLPAGWTVLVSRSTGHTFYHNEESGESTFEWPVPPESGGKMSGIGDAAATEPPPPPGWEVVVSRRTGTTGDTYYLDEVTGESTYDVPSVPAGSGLKKERHADQPPISPSIAEPTLVHSEPPKSPAGTMPSLAAPPLATSVEKIEEKESIAPTEQQQRKHEEQQQQRQQVPQRQKQQQPLKQQSTVQQHKRLVQQQEQDQADGKTVAVSQDMNDLL